MSSSATGVGMPICFLGTILLILTQKSSQKFGDVLGIVSVYFCLAKAKKRHVFVVACVSEVPTWSGASLVNRCRLEVWIKNHS